MKFVGIVGSIQKESYNKKLLNFVKNKFKNLIDIEILDINGVPLFNQDLKSKDYPILKELNDKIIDSDGVIIVTPEHNFTIPALLKSLIEWLSFEYHPFTNKPVMILGASYTEQGSSRAQLHLRQILDSPGVDALVMPGSEYLLSNAKEKFDENGDITDERTIDYTEHVLLRFIKFAEIANQLNLESLNTNYIKKKNEGSYKIVDNPYANETTGPSETSGASEALESSETNNDTETSGASEY